MYAEAQTENEKTNPTKLQTLDFCSSLAPNIHSPAPAVITVKGMKTTDMIRLDSERLRKKIVDAFCRLLRLQREKTRMNKLADTARSISSATNAASNGPTMNSLTVKLSGSLAVLFVVFIVTTAKIEIESSETSNYGISKHIIPYGVYIIQSPTNVTKYLALRIFVPRINSI